MRDGDDLKKIFEFAVNHREGEFVQEVPTSSVRMFGPAPWVLSDLLNSVVDFGYESLSCSLAADLVPLPCGGRLINSLRVEVHRKRGH